jgi:ABC-type transport system involved in cytochrome bd biosynthesis fused ATPase/permease subunit
LPEEQNLSKYKAIYEICKDAYREERERRDKLDGKSQTFLVIVGFEITLLGLVYNAFKTVIGNWNYLFIILAVLSCIAILVSLVFLVRSLFLRDFETYPHLNVITGEFKDKTEIDLFASMANHFKKIESHNITEYERKAWALKIGSWVAIISAFFVLGTFCLIIYWNLL